MHQFKIQIVMTVVSIAVTALPVNIAEQGLSQADLDTILKVALAPRQSTGSYQTGIAGGEFDDPDPPGDEHGQDDDGDDVMPEAFLESDVDAGGESDVGNDAVGVASGLAGQGGAGSSALNHQSQGSTSVFCSLFSCAAASQSDGKVSTTVGGGISNATGPLITINGPLITIHASKNETKNTHNYYGQKGI